MTSIFASITSRRRSCAGTVALCAWLVVGHVPDLRAEEPSLADFPFVIHCKFKNTSHAFYASRLSPDGTAVYAASDRIAGTISLTGEAKAIGSEVGGSCAGKTLKELRASGQAFDLSR